MDLDPHNGDPYDPFAWDQAFAWRDPPPAPPPPVARPPAVPVNDVPSPDAPFAFRETVPVQGPPMPPVQGPNLPTLGEKLAETWPAQLAKSAWSGFTLPGDAYAGKVDPNSPETLGRALDFAGLVTGGAGLSGVPVKAGEEVLGAGAVRRFEQQAARDALREQARARYRDPNAPVEAPAAPPVEEIPPAPRGHNLPPPGALPQERVPLLHRESPFSEHLDDMHPDEAALNVGDILHPDTPALKARSRGVKDIAAELHSRSQAALTRLGVPNGMITEGGNQNHDELISRAMAQEARQALARSGINASDWYTAKVDHAMATASTMYPEIASDEHARTAFQAAMAITSQGEVVNSNAKLTDWAYDVYRRTGRFPENMNTGEPGSLNAKEAPSMNANFKKLNDILEHHGPEGLHTFLNNEYTVGELKRMGYPIGSGELVTNKVYGSAILGSKIGQGFYQNLRGNYDPTTFDLWWMRNYGRLTGTLVGKTDISKQTARLDNAIREVNRPVYGPQEQGFDIDRERLRAAQAETGIRTPKTDAERLVLARELFKQHERDFEVNRPLYNSGERVKTELTNASQRMIEGLQGINQAPMSGGQRNWMRARVDRAREILRDHGVDVTPADLQAILWYPEKDLYSKLGGRESAGLNVDYASAMRAQAKSKGISDEQIDAAIRSLPRSRGAGPSGRSGADDAGTIQVGGQGNRGAYPQQPQDQEPPVGGGAFAGGRLPQWRGRELEPVTGDPFD